MSKVSQKYFGSFGADYQTAMAVLEPIIQQAISAHETGNYDLFVEVITHEHASRVSREGFAKGFELVAPQLGKLNEKVFLGSLNREGDPVLLFRAEYQLCPDDVLITVQFKNDTRPPLIEYITIE